jgi:hypothetical protein
MIGELMSVMRHEETNPISPFLSHFEEQSRFDWSWTNWFSSLTHFLTFIPFLFIIIAIYIICFRKPNTHSSPSEHMNLTINPLVPERRTIRRMTWTVPDILNDISRVQPRLPHDFTTPPTPNSTPSNDSPNIPITPDVPTLQQVLPIFPIPIPTIPSLPTNTNSPPIDTSPPHQPT